MASKINPTLAKSLIKEFQEHNEAADGMGLKTPEGNHVHGYFMDRESIESILSDPNVAGISLYHAKHPDHAGSPNKVFTLAYTGAEPNTEANAKTPYLNKQEVYTTPVCPPYCGNLG